MDSFEDRMAKVIWRSLRGHVEADHELEVRRLPDRDQEIHCCWCGNTVVAGSPGIVQHVAKVLKESGAKITNVRPVVEAL